MTQLYHAEDLPERLQVSTEALACLFTAALYTAAKSEPTQKSNSGGIERVECKHSGIFLGCMEEPSHTL